MIAPLSVDSAAPRALSAQESQEIKGEMVSAQIATPVRFLSNGCNFNISTGATMARGTNVMHQTVYWAFTRETSLKVARYTNTKAVFSE